MADLMTIIQPVIQILIAVLLLVLILAFYHIYKIVRDISLITDRVEMLSDVRGWFKIFNRFKHHKKKKRKVIYEDEE